MKKGYKIIVTTEETDEVIEDMLDEVLREISSRERMDLIVKMTDEEIDKEYDLTCKD